MAGKLKAQHLLDLTFVSNPKLHPSGERAVVVKTVIVPADGDKPPRYKSNLEMFNLTDKTSYTFTQGAFSDTQPLFSPDGEQLAFISRRQEDAKAQLFVMPVAGGEARQLSSFKAGVQSYCWHPDSKQLAVVSKGDYEDETAKKGLARITDRMTYKADGQGFTAQQAAHIYLLNVDDGKSEQLTDAVTDPHSLVFSADGKTLFYCASATQDDAHFWLENIWALRLKTRKTKALLKKPAMVGNLSPSPDGKLVAFTAPSIPGLFPSNTGLWVVKSTGGKPQLLTGELDVSNSKGGDTHYGAYPNTAVWSADSSSVCLNINHEGRSHLAKLTLGNNAINYLQDADCVVSSFDQVGVTTVFLMETPTAPAELFIRYPDGNEEQLSNFNATFKSTHTLLAPSEHSFTTKDGTNLTYWRLEPEKARKDKALIVQVHGGPHTAYGYSFFYEFHYLAAAGYSVIYGNPRGSSSFSNEFATSMLGGYGTVDADDVLAITEHARKHHKKKSAPVHLTGGSYGGFMTNWLVGHTNMFASAVTQRSISNWLSFYGTSDIGYRFSEIEVAGNPWENTEKLWEQSPLKYVHNVRTPLLIIHSEQDHRCPIEQAEQFYIALKRLGHTETRFIRFPDEGHELSRSGRPDRRIQRLEFMLDWFDTHAPKRK